jgi:hypothetical protein
MNDSGDDFRWALLDKETIIWSGRPGQGLRLTSRDWLLIPFSLLWGGFAIFWETSVWQISAPQMFRLWGVPFVLAGLYLIAGRFVVDAWLRGRTYYAVTSRRILIARSGFAGKLIALAIDRLPDVQLSQGADGRGTIQFGQPVAAMWGRNGFGGWSPALDPTPQFIAIDDAQGVFDKIQRTIQTSR